MEKRREWIDLAQAYIFWACLLPAEAAGAHHPGPEPRHGGGHRAKELSISQRDIYAGYF